MKNRREDIVPPQAKVSGNYTSPMQAKWNARRAGYDEILLVDEDGYVAEGPTTNVFLVDAEGVLATPPQEKVLHGVTRSSILELARAEGLRARGAQDPARGARARRRGVPDRHHRGRVARRERRRREDPRRRARPGERAARAALPRRHARRRPAFAHWLTPVNPS